MNDGPKLAIAILVMWVALVFFFFAFHPGGVKNVSNPGEMLKWLVDEFTKLAGGSTAATLSDVTTGGTSTDNLSYPGFTDQSSGSGNVNPGGVTVA